MEIVVHDSRRRPYSHKPVFVVAFESTRLCKSGTALGSYPGQLVWRLPCRRGRYVAGETKGEPLRAGNAPLSDASPSRGDFRGHAHVWSHSEWRVSPLSPLQLEGAAKTVQGIHWIYPSTGSAIASFGFIAISDMILTMVIDTCPNVR